jgi:hypothetical protein
MRMIHTLVLLVVLAAAPATARADVAIGAFFGEPTGLNLKLGLDRRSALDIVLGWYNHWDNWNDDGAYAHLTYLVTPHVSHGRSVSVPLRVGIGAAIFDDVGRYDGDVHLAARMPLQIGLVFHGAPLELYGEIALKVTVVDPGPNHRTVDLDGGLGLRFYF